jgi:hypothetical protein
MFAIEDLSKTRNNQGFFFLSVVDFSSDDIPNDSRVILIFEGIDSFIDVGNEKEREKEANVAFWLPK